MEANAKKGKTKVDARTNEVETLWRICNMQNALSTCNCTAKNAHNKYLQSLLPSVSGMFGSLTHVLLLQMLLMQHACRQNMCPQLRGQLPTNEYPYNE
eukprot:768200-Amphidinium_carterae.1